MDVDQSELRALMAFFNMRARYGVTPTLWRTPDGGVHLIVRDLPIGYEEAFLERALFNDDKSRVWLDAACSHKPMQTLFAKKGSDGVTKWRQSLDERGLLALPGWVNRSVRKNR